MDNRLSKVSFFLFVFIYNYLWIRIIIFPYFYNNYGNESYIYGFIISVLVTLFFLILPKIFYVKDLYYLLNKSRFRFVYWLLFMMEAIFGVVYIVYILDKLFINNFNIYLGIIAFFIVINILSKMKPSDVINLSTLFIIVTILLVCFSFIYYIPLDFSEMIVENIKFDMFILNFSFMLFFDNLSLLFIDKDNFKLSKFKIIIPVFIAVIFFILEIMLMILSVGDFLFKDISWVGFLTFGIKPVAKYVNNFDFVYIVILIVSFIFKFSYNFSIIKSRITKNNIIVNSILIICSSFIFRLVSINDVIYRIYLVNIIKGIIFIWIVMEVSDVFKVKRK